MQQLRAPVNAVMENRFPQRGTEFLDPMSDCSLLNMDRVSMKLVDELLRWLPCF